MTRVPVAIVGTAGRTAGQLARLDARAYRLMTAAVLQQLVRWGLRRDQVIMVSGGSAWADHVAVTLILRRRPSEWGGLELHLPCEFVEEKRRFDDTRAPGRSLNRYHDQQTGKLGRSSLDDLHEARERGARFVAGYAGFHARNTAVAAAASYMVALTFSAGDAPDGTSRGTRDTWRKCRGTKAHVSLERLLCGGAAGQQAGRKRGLEQFGFRKRRRTADPRHPATPLKTVRAHDRPAEPAPLGVTLALHPC